MQIRVLYFAVVRERLRREEELLSLEPGATVASLLEELGRRHPPVAELRSALQVAVNQELAPAGRALSEGDEVALIPPVSGGSGPCRVTDAPLALEEVVAAVSHAAQGALVSFTGVVRAESHGKRIRRLEYEAYRPMAERKLAEVAASVEAEWPGVRVAIVHRVGVLQVGEAAVVLAASAPHRKAAFLACEAAIDRLKQAVPIWKKEIAEDGEAWIGLGP